jgi:ATP-binding cassette subfamily B protein
MRRGIGIMSIFKYFWLSIKPYKQWYCLMMLAPLVTSFYTPATNFAVKTIIDAIVTTPNISFSALIFPIVIFIAAQLLMDIAWRLSNFAEWKSEPYVRKDLLVRTYDYTQHHSYSFFQNNFTGSLTNKITKIVDGYNKFWSELHHGFLINLLNTIVGMASLFLINKDIGFFVSVWSLILFITIYLLSAKLIKISDNLSQAKHRLVGALSDKLSNISSIILFSGRKSAKVSLEKQIDDDVIPREIREYKYNFMIQIIGGIFYLIMLISLLFILIKFKKQNIISVGDFTYIFATMLAVGHDLWNLVTKLQEFFSYMGEAQSSLDILSIPHEIKDKAKAKELKIKTPSIEYKNLHFYYKNHLIFENLNIKIHAGEKVGLVGHSGAGKSSLVNLLLKYFYPASGSILIDGSSIENVTQDSLRNNIAMIPQDILLFHDSIMENIRYSKPNATDDEVVEAAKKSYIHDYIITLPHGYNTTVGERGLKISGGQRQRVAIARAILKDAPILILDEATSSLDSKTEKLIQEGIELLLKDTKKTVIAIAHRLSTIKDMDRIIVLDKGKIVEEGTHFQLMKIKNGIYRDLWKHQKI